MIGAQLRRARQGAGLSLAALSEVTDVSIGAISNIERGTSSPSIRTLRSLTNALGISIGDLFGEGGEPSRPSPEFVVRRDDRRRLRFWRTGISKELLTRVEQTNIELFYLTIEPYGSTGDAYTHRGEEAGFVIEGLLELTVDSETVVLREGDAFGFRSDRPHSFSNPAGQWARVLWVNTGNEKEL
ncbi:helix-turn-helix domain-containing protein [Rhodosalinus sp. FB01]|uniref:helix-turn-helix domain-containing protein n=1 Tax=Rhodosalinus sp. FB01 TaxID=3239194 RepID=UPI003524FEA8